VTGAHLIQRHLPEHRLDSTLDGDHRVKAVQGVEQGVGLVEWKRPMTAGL
jgi:hypothetical protein